jgi:hypothetical protein
MKRFVLSTLLLASPVFAVQVPAGAELEIRITTKIASETMHVHDPVSAVLIAPVLVNGRITLPLMARITGEVKQTRAAGDAGAAQLEIVFNRVGVGSYGAAMTAVATAVENARETVDEKGVITGIDASRTYGGRLNEGISKLEGNDRLAALATILQTAKRGLQIEDVNPNIDYDAGAELTLKLTAPLDWQGPTIGPESKLQPFPNESSLADLVNHESFRTTAQSPARPSDITNLMFIATEEGLRAAFTAAGWFTASPLSTESKLETARALIEDRGYREGPMSILTLNGEPPAFSWQKGNNTFSSRHHLRIFARPERFDGKPVWVCSSTHDIGIDFSERDRTFIHKIDSNIDKERAKVVDDLLGTGMVRSLAIVDRPDIPQDLTNATGDALHTDGGMAVLLIQ